MVDLREGGRGGGFPRIPMRQRAIKLAQLGKEKKERSVYLRDLPKRAR